MSGKPWKCFFKGTEPGKTDPMVFHDFLKERIELSGENIFDFAGSHSLTEYGSSKLQWRTSFSGHHLSSVLDSLNWVTERESPCWELSNDTKLVSQRLLRSEFQNQGLIQATRGNSNRNFVSRLPEVLETNRVDHSNALDLLISSMDMTKDLVSGEQR